MWEELITLNLTNNWQVTPITSATIFKLKHAIENYNNQNQLAQIALVNIDAAPIEIFESKRILARPEAEIIQFSKLLGWQYKLGIRQITLLGKQPIDWTIKVEAAQFESNTGSNNMTVSNNIIFGNGQPQQLIEDTRPKYKHYVALENVTSVNDGEWVDVSNFKEGSLEITGLPETIDFSTEEYTLISICGSNSLTKPNNSEQGYFVNSIGSNGFCSTSVYTKWLKVRISRYKEDGSSITGIMFLT